MPNRRDILKLAPLAAAWPFAMNALAQTTSDIPKAKKPLRILILGGTGFIGPHQVRYALARGHQLTLFHRSEPPAEFADKVETLIGDRNTGDLSALAGRDWDVCIDNPTTLPFWVRDVGKQLQGKVGRYVFISTISTYAKNDHVDADETDALAAYTGKDAMAETADTLKADPSLYGPLKAVSEREAEKWFAKNTIVIRPGLIVGPGDHTDRFTYWPARLARGGAVLAPGDGKDPVQFIDVRDLTQWTIRMAESGAPGTYNALGPQQPLTMAAMLETIRATTKTPVDVHWASDAFLDKNGVQAWSDMPVWIPRAGDEAGFARRTAHKAQAAGLSYRPLSTTVADTLAWFHSQPAERQQKLRAGITAERENALLAALAKDATPG